MKKMKKILAMLLALTMVLGMGLTSMAAEPLSSDTASVTITNVTKDEIAPTVTLYQIARGEYDTDGSGLLGYVWADNEDEIVDTTTLFADVSKPEVDEITAIANKLLSTGSDKLNPIKVITSGTFSETTYTATVSAGAYIAIITGADDGKVYNPILLTATYNAAGSLVEGSVNANESYLYGTQAIAKSSAPNITKEMTNGTTTDNLGTADTTDDKETASVGDMITYTVTPTMPSYPKNAVNKTFFISDTMSSGLTFDYSSLTVTINGTNIEANSSNEFVYDTKVIAVAAPTYDGTAGTVTGFNLNFNYENLLKYSTTTEGEGEEAVKTTSVTVYQPIVSYKAVVNEKAVVGGSGNVNTANLYYANQPNTGSTHTTTNKPSDDADGVEKTEVVEKVYTYQIAFKKVDDSSTPNPLADAVFGIYRTKTVGADGKATLSDLVDIVKTNESGYAVSTNVAAGKYYIQEIKAPTGYSLNADIFEVTASWTTATTKVTETVTDRTYTTNINESVDKVQVGWILNSKFYAMDEFTPTTAEIAGAQVAYVKAESTVTTSNVTTESDAENGGTALLTATIPNTKLNALPSTGGIGTTIFTVAGCGIMIAAAFFFFASRKKEN